MKRKMPLLKHVMTPFPYAIESSALVSEARRMMLEHDIRHLPVTEGDHKLVGVISDRDVAMLYSLGDHLVDSAKFTVWQICSRDPYRVDLECDVATVVLEMSERKIGSVLVTKDGRLAGVFTTTDACRLLGEHLRSLYGSPSPEIPPEAA